MVWYGTFNYPGQIVHITTSDSADSSNDCALGPYKVSTNNQPTKSTKRFVK